MTNPTRTLLGTTKPIPLYNAFLARQEILVYDPTTNLFIPWVVSGGSVPTVRLSLFPSGFDMNGYPSTLLGPFAMAPSAVDDVYYAELSADLVTNALGALVGTVVYQVIEGAYGSVYSNLSSSQPLLVINPRNPS